MKTTHLEVLVEEPSMEEFLRGLLPRILGDELTFHIYPSNGKLDLLDNLPQRLRGYSSWLPPTWRIVVIVDRDDDDCLELKRKLESIADEAGLKSKSTGRSNDWQVVNRIAVEELEAWFLGDMDAVRAVYRRVPATLEKQASFRDPDNIRGGTWETFERILQKAGHYQGGYRKITAARELARHMVPARNRSHSFQVFRDTLLGL